MDPTPWLSVYEYTLRAPYTVGPHEPLGNARRLMEKYGVRDLPVRSEGKLVGILSERELRLLPLFSTPAETLTVEDAMASDPYSVPSDAPLDAVVRTMAAKNIEAAVVLEDGHVLGVFTPFEAMHALVDALQGKLAQGPRRSSRTVTSGRRAERTRPAR